MSIALKKGKKLFRGGNNIFAINNIISKIPRYLQILDEIIIIAILNRVYIKKGYTNQISREQYQQCYLKCIINRFYVFSDIQKRNFNQSHISIRINMVISNR